MTKPEASVSIGPADQLGASREAVQELAPVLRRAVTLDPEGLARLRFHGGTAAVLVRLPFDVLVARTITYPEGVELDVTVRATDLIAWLDDPQAAPPHRYDEQWRTGLPPSGGWRRIDTVADDVVRGLVRRGALAVKEHAGREGVAGAQLRPEVADALLDSVVLTVSPPPGEPPAADAQITLRTLSALLRMGFLARDSHIAVDATGRWIRVAAAYGSVYVERPGLGLNQARGVGRS